MSRVKRGVTARKRRKRLLKLAKGNYGKRKSAYKIAAETVRRALRYAFAGRKIKKRDYRGLWIQRINAATRLYGLTYGKFMAALKTHQIELNRKVLADLALNHPTTFETLIQKVKA